MGFQWPDHPRFNQFRSPDSDFGKRIVMHGGFFATHDPDSGLIKFFMPNGQLLLVLDLPFDVQFLAPLVDSFLLGGHYARQGTNKK